MSTQDKEIDYPVTQDKIDNTFISTAKYHDIKPLWLNLWNNDGCGFGEHGMVCIIRSAALFKKEGLVPLLIVNPIYFSFKTPNDTL
jgi:hypothetical protein